jgi:hypothetical protein
VEVTGGLSRGGAKPLLHLRVVDQAGLLEDGAASGQNDEVGDAPDLETGGELRVGFGVDLEDDGLAGHIGCGACDLGRGGSAMGGRAALQEPHLPVSLRCLAGMRFFCWQWGQVRMTGTVDLAWLQTLDAGNDDKYSVDF